MIERARSDEAVGYEKKQVHFGKKLKEFFKNVLVFLLHIISPFLFHYLQQSSSSPLEKLEGVYFMLSVSRLSMLPVSGLRTRRDVYFRLKSSPESDSVVPNCGA